MHALQPLCQDRGAFAAEHHPGMSEPELGRPKVVEHVNQRLAEDGQAEQRIASPELLLWIK